MKIHWSVVDNDPDMSMAFYHPQKLSDNIPKHLQNSEYHRCPAFTQKIKNTYVLRSPWDLDFTIDKNGVYSTNELMSKVNFENMSSRILQVHMPYIFFAESSCEATIMHPYLHHNSFTDNGNTVYGQYNIGKWFRPIQAGFILNDKGHYEYNIKRGDIFAYINFETSERLDLEHFHPTNEILSIMEKCLNLKKAKKGVFSLDRCYDFMLYYTYNKRLKQILRG
jgi:hypothetical protein